MDPYSLVMVPASIESTRYRFGEFELSPDQGELLESGRRVRIQPQPLRVLSILVAHAGNLVRRDELFAQVWGEDTHVDFDRGLNYCIKQIRTALGDDASEPRFVGTVPRFGYRFVAEVEVLGPAQAPSKAPLATGSRHGATIVAAVVACLLVLVSVGMAWRFAPAQTAPHRADPEALREFLRGRHLIDSGSVEDALEGLEHLENAVILDPEFARGHLALARGLVRVPGDREQTLSRARSAAQRSVQLDPGMAEAHAFLGSLSLFGEWDFETAELAYRRALDLEPSNATLRHEYASLLAIMGQHESALLQIGRAMELDPVSTSIKADAGWFYYQARRFDEAEKLCQVTLTIDPRNENALWCLLQTYRLSGREREALDAAKRWRLCSTPPCRRCPTSKRSGVGI